MIPKILHYCWFGNHNTGKLQNKCIRSWEKILPDFQIKLWNENNSPLDVEFVKEAYKQRKYAFVADYVRLWALKEFGGVYLDTDMLLLKDISPLLNNSFFAGYQSIDSIAAGIIGSVPDHPYVYDLLEYYKKQKFSEEKMTDLAIPIIMTRIASEKPYDLKLYDPEFFYPFPFEASIENPSAFRNYIKPESYAVHLWDASWIKGMKEYRKGKNLTNRILTRFLPWKIN